MAIEFGKQIPFQKPNSGRGGMRKRDIGHNAYIARMREALDLGEHRKVVRETREDSLRTLSDFESKHKAEAENRRQLYQFEQAKIDTADRATAENIRQWNQYSRDEIESIGKQAELLSAFSDSALQLTGKAVSLVDSIDKAKKDHELEIKTEYGRKAAELKEERQQQQNDENQLLDNVDKQANVEQDILSKHLGLPLVLSDSSDEISSAQNLYQNHWSTQFKNRELTTKNAKPLMLETYNEVLLEFKSDNLKRPGNSQFSQKELGILALDYVSELFNIKGVSTPEARAARKVLRERYQSLINQEFQRNNIHGSKVIWNQRVDNVLQGEDLTVETLSNLIATVTHPDSIFYNPQTQNKMGELDFLKYIIKRVGSNNEELINKLLNDVKPLRNGKPIGKNINSWIDLYKGDIDKHWSDFKTSSSIAEERRNKQEREEEGENQLNVILGSWNAVPGSDGYEGSGHYHMQQYLLGDEEGFIDWYNKKRINLIAYPEALEKFDSVMFKGGFDEAKGITKLERTKRLLEKGEVRRFLKSLNEETWPSTEKRELEALIPGAEYLLGIANVDTRFKQISKQLANKAGLVDLWTESGVDAIEGLRATTYRYQAEEIKLFLSFLGTDMTPENAWSQAQTAMKGIVNEGFDDSSSPYYWKQPEASKGTMPTEPGSYGNALPGPKDSNHNPDDVINWITNEIDPSSDTNKDNFIVTDIRTLIQNPSQLGKKSFFSTVDINEIAAQLKYGVKIHLTPYMKEVYNGVRHKVPEYTETQFLEDILIGAGYNVTPGNINQRDVFQANSEGKHKALIVNDKSLNSLKAFRIDAYRVALTVEGGQRLTINNKTAQEIDYDGVVKEKDWKWLENQGGFLNEEKFNFLLNNGIDIENDILFPPIDLGRIAEDSVTVYKDSAAFQQLNEKLEMYFPGNWKDLPIPKDSPVHFR